MWTCHSLCLQSPGHWHLAWCQLFLLWSCYKHSWARHLLTCFFISFGQRLWHLFWVFQFHPCCCKWQYFLLLMHITVSLAMHLLMDIQVVSMSWLLWIVLLWTMTCMYPFKLLFVLDISPGVELLGHRASYFLFPKTLPYCSPQWLHQFTLLPTATRVPFPLHPCQHLLLADFLMMTIQPGVRW